MGVVTRTINYNLEAASCGGDYFVLNGQKLESQNEMLIDAEVDHLSSVPVEADARFRK